ncbi:MAG: HAD family acid phosphatase [Steroidobacteraceae bacterium]
MGITRGLTLLGALALAACALAPPQPTPQVAAAAGRCGPAPAFAAGGERATLWLRHSAEFRAASETLYRAAEAALRAGLADPAWTAEPAQMGDMSKLPPAVVMDIDETVLDNSAPQARMILEETCFEEFEAVWDAWVAERAAPAVPGAAAFIRAARAMNDPEGRPVRLFFVTNRECTARPGNDSACPQQDDTAANLERLGLGAPALADDLMIKGERADWVSEKLSRRLEIAKSHRIVLNVGDDFGDFLPDVRRQTAAERERARCVHRERWGRQWFMIPNPMYGSWLVTLGPDPAVALAADPPVAANCDTP